jgi:hypothetical protein
MSNITKFEEEKQSLEHLRGLAAIAAKSGNYQNMSPDTMLNIMLTARDLNISPMKALNGGFYVVNGKISMSTALMVDRIRKEGHSIKIPEWTADKCVVIGIRKDNEDSIKFEFTMQDANNAGLTNSPTWKKFPKQMLYNRAMSTLARTLFPDVVGNAYSEDEAHDIRGIPPHKRPDEDPDVVVSSSKQFHSADAVIVVDTADIKTHSGKTPNEQLQDTLSADGIPCERLHEFLDMRAKLKNASIDDVIKAALFPDFISKFKASFKKWLSEKATPAA